MSFNENLAAAIGPVFSGYIESYPPLEVILLATSDGFPVHIQSNHLGNIEVDMIAAAASTLYSVSNAVSQNILGKEFKVTIIETLKGNVAFVAVSLNDKDFVLMMSAKETMNIANLRILLHRLSSTISELSLP